MSRVLTVLMAGAIAVGTAQSATVTMINTFGVDQAPPSGGPGPNAPSVMTVFGGATTVHALGVTFAFAGSAAYGDAIGTAVNLLEPQFTDTVLDGAPDGTLTLTFDAPTTFLSFNILFAPLMSSSGGQVLIGGVSTPFTTTINGTSCGGFCSIGTFSLTPASSFTQAVISFDASAASAQFFAIDNLSYDAPDRTSAAATPEPASFTLIGLGTLLLTGATRIRRASARP
jgi:hypothetical protein